MNYDSSCVMDNNQLKELYRELGAADDAFARMLEGVYGRRMVDTVREQPHKWTAPVRAAWGKVEAAQLAFDGAGGREWLRRAGGA